jgi:hypothetical protein
LKAAVFAFFTSGVSGTTGSVVSFSSSSGASAAADSAANYSGVFQLLISFLHVELSSCFSAGLSLYAFFLSLSA